MCPESRWCTAAGDDPVKTLTRDTDSRLYARFISLVGGVIDGGTGCGVVGAPGLRGKDA